MAPIPKSNAKSDPYDYLVIGGGAASLASDAALAFLLADPFDSARLALQALEVSLPLYV